MRRYKYLEKMFEEEMKKVLVFIKGFTPIDRIKLARMTALWIGELLFLLVFTSIALTSPDLPLKILRILYSLDLWKTWNIKVFGVLTSDGIPAPGDINPFTF